MSPRRNDVEDQLVTGREWRNFAKGLILTFTSLVCDGRVTTNQVIKSHISADPISSALIRWWERREGKKLFRWVLSLFLTLQMRWNEHLNSHFGVLFFLLCDTHTWGREFSLTIKLFLCHTLWIHSHTQALFNGVFVPTDLFWSVSFSFSRSDWNVVL